MKYLVSVFMVAIVTMAGLNAQTLFSQDFTAGGTTTTYVSGTPTTGQFDAISTTGGAKAWSISSNTLAFASTGTNSAYASRSTDFTSTPAAAMVTFDFIFTSSSTALTSAFDMALGSGFGTANASESNANTYAKFGLNFTATNGYTVRDISGTTNGATTFGTGTSTFTWVLNNSGSTISYTAPDASIETLANDTWDLWVGTSKQLNDRAVTTATQNITDWKLGFSGNGTYAMSFDNFSVTTVAIPEPSTYALLIGGGLGLFALLRRRRVQS